MNNLLSQNVRLELDAGPFHLAGDLDRFRSQLGWLVRCGAEELEVVTADVTVQELPAADTGLAMAFNPQTHCMELVHTCRLVGAVIARPRAGTTLDSEPVALADVELRMHVGDKTQSLSVPVTLACAEALH